MSASDYYLKLVRETIARQPKGATMAEKAEAMQYVWNECKRERAQEQRQKSRKPGRTALESTGCVEKAGSSSTDDGVRTGSKSANQENKVIAMLRCTVPWLNVGRAIASIREDPIDGRPFLTVRMNDRQIECLVDTGASVSVLASETFEKVFGMDSLPKEGQEGPQVTSITGNPMSVRDYVEIEIQVLGRQLKRPFLVVDGLKQHECVLGYDFVKEEGVKIDGASNEVAFTEKEVQGQPWKVAGLHTIRRTTVFPRSIQHIQVQARIGGKALDSGEKGVTSGASSGGLAVWESLNETQERGTVWLAVVNMSKQRICIKGDQQIAEMKNPERCNIEIKPLNDKTVASIFGEMKPDKPDPARGLVAELTENDWQELKKKLQIFAPAEKKGEYEKLFRQYHDVCSRNKMDLGFSDMVEHKIVMRTTEPVHVRQFRVPFAHEEVLHSYIDELLKQGAIEVSRSPYNSPIFCVTKKLPPDAPPGTPPPLRCVLDFRQVNAASLPDRYSIKEVRECIDEVGKLKSDVFTTIDLTAGFWQQRLEEGSRQYTAFSVPGKGARYQWKVTPMGLQGSPASFSRLMDFVMRNIEGVLTYVDDVLVHSKGHDKHIKIVEQALWRLRKYGLKLNVSKTIIGAAQVQYLGYTISGDGVSPSKDKMEAVRELGPPRDVRAVREFIGMTNYFRFLIPHFSSKIAPLTALTTKASTWREGPLPDKAAEAFKTIKEFLISAPIVKYPRREGQFVLHTDACSGESAQGKTRPGGFGAVLMQEQEGAERVIAYASRSLRDHEKNYSAFLLEMAAAVFGIEHFDTYLIGKRFILRMDHRPLEKMGSIHQKTLNRLQQLMLEFDFKLEYRKGSENVVPDFLSRNVAGRPGDEISRMIGSIEVVGIKLAELQQADSETKAVAEILRQGVRTRRQHADKGQTKAAKLAQECQLVDNIVWHVSERDGRKHFALFAPTEVRRIILRAAHCAPDAGHGGVDRTVNRIKLDHWWPGMRQDVEDYISRCQVCQMTKSRDPKPSPLQSLPVPERPNERVHIDLFGPLKTSETGNKYVMVMTDAFSKYVELTAILDKSAKTVAKSFLERWICRFSAPVMIVTDQGKEFCNHVLKSVCQLWDIDKSRTSPFHPQSNSAAESYNRSLIKYMRAVIKDNQTLDWEELLPVMSLSYNCHVHRSTGQTPFFLTFLHDPRLPVFDLEKPRQFYKHGYVEDSYITMQNAFGRARMSMTEATEKSKAYYDRKAQERSFQEGDKVLVHFPNVPPGQNQKFYTKWRPFQVIRTIGKLNVQCQDLQKNSKPIIVHVDRVIKFRMNDNEARVASLIWEDAAMEGPASEEFQQHRTEDDELWDSEVDLEIRMKTERRQPVSPGTASEEHGQHLESRSYEDPWLQLGKYFWGSFGHQTDRGNGHETHPEREDTGTGEGSSPQVTTRRQNQGQPGDKDQGQGASAGSSEGYKYRHTRSRGSVEDIPLPRSCWTRKKK